MAINDRYFLMMQGIPIFFYTIPMQIYLLKLPLSSDVFAKNLELLKCYLHPSDYGLLSAKTNSQMLSAMGKISVQYLYGRQASAQGSVYPLPFAYTKEGKPYLEGCSDFCFNISHTKEWVAVAVGTADIGVDIELLRTYKPTVAKRFFHPEEYSLLETLPPQLHNEMFTRLWTLKESYVKYTGTGIANNFDKFAISINLSGLRIKGNDSPVCFKQYNYDGLFVSACSATDVFPANIILLTMEEILHTVGN